MKHGAMRSAIALALASSLGGCYSLTIHAERQPLPVSMTGTLGRPATVIRHFHHASVSWYFFGLAGFASFPGADNPWTPPGGLVARVIESELMTGGDGVINLRVRQRATPQAEAIALVPSAALGLIPHAPIWVTPLLLVAFQPLTLEIDGDLVRFNHPLPANGERD